MWDDNDSSEAQATTVRQADYLLRLGWGLIIAGFAQLGIEYSQNYLPSGLYFLLIPIGAVLLGLRCWLATHRALLTIAWVGFPLLALAAFFALVG